ncbi:hypothetical protein PAECIP111891_04247 [Paenibacillus allorhizoplanae]|uniref:Uncharacterized protein n=1 Tax=Paenibacillus allorhizoplanae TaxID=2905648 RepID=A0ABM9CK83_9BACL|nr:hypothetical protein PAECIP111891_04247 [Paenibacillus allorhizoplanae]
MKYIFKVLVALIPSLILIFFLLNYFPNTGLGSIIALPFIFVINAALIIIGITFIHRLNQPLITAIWILILVLTLVVTILIYPQEYGPSVFIQLWNKTPIGR